MMDRKISGSQNYKFILFSNFNPVIVNFIKIRICGINDLFFLNKISTKLKNDYYFGLRLSGNEEYGPDWSLHKFA